MPQARPVGPAPMTMASNAGRSVTVWLSTSAAMAARACGSGGGIFAAAFRHVGTAAAFASHRLGERADQFAGLELAASDPS